MRYELPDILDLSKLQKLMDLLYRAAGMPVGIIDTHGRILVATGWQDICTRFHRVNPETAAICRKSDLYIAGHLGEGDHIAYKCGNGLWDVAFPIVIDGGHAATLFVGQFFYENETPDTGFFEKQADRYGFDKKDYLDALSRVPVFSRRRMEHIIGYYAAFVEMLVDTGLTNMRMRESERSLRDSEERYRKLVQSVNSIILRWNTSGEITFFNEYAESFFGYRAEDVRGRSIIGTILPEHDSTGRDLEAMVRDIVHDPGRYKLNENENMRADGERVWVLWTNRALLDKDGNLVEILSVGNDRTERRRLDEALRKSEARLKAAQRIARMGVYEFELPDGEVVWSPETYDICRRDTSQPPPSQEEYERLVHPDDRERLTDELTRSIEEHDRFDLVYRLVPPDGSPVHVHSVGQAVYGDDGEPTSFFGILRDITEERTSAERLESSLAEKEVLLREIHHRVKNNMQVISSLLMLQKDQVSEDAVRTILETGIGRIRAMALIHEHLYGGRSLASIDLGEYLVRVCTNIADLDPAGNRVVLKYDIEDMEISVDKAVYCGLVVNELVTNAFRHGFPDDSSGTVTVSLHCAEGECVLGVRDDGAGLPDGFDWDSRNTLGLKLVRTLVERQLEGSIRLDDPSRASFVIVIPAA